MFSILIITSALCIFLIFYARLIIPLNAPRYINTTLIIIFLLLSFSPHIAMRLTRILGPDSEYALALHIAYYAMSYIILLVIAVIIRDIAAFIAKFITHLKTKPDQTPEQYKHNAERRRFLLNASSLALIPVAGVLTPVAAIAAKKRILKHFTLHYPNMPDNLKSLKIVHLSDIHLGNTFTKQDLQNVVEETNALKPDIIAITGDFVDGNFNALKSDAKPLEHLKPSIATCFCTGNHEYYSIADPWIEYLRSININVLNNENITLKHNNTDFAVAGAIDWNGDRKNKIKSSPKKALQNIPDDHFKIMLVHQPKSVDESIENGADLVLAGHTHGGQFFPVSLLNERIHQYARGLYAVGDVKVIISAGTGYWGPPNRIGVPPEIILITFK